MNHRIVIIDDNFAIRQIVKVFLSVISKKFAIAPGVFSTNNGIEGLGYIYITSPDIIIVDTTIPKYSGRDVIDYLVSNPRFQSTKTKVIVLQEQYRKHNFPSHFLVINKSNKNAFNQLCEVLLTCMQISPKETKPALFSKLGSFVFSSGNKDDLLQSRVKNRLSPLRAISKSKWFGLSILTSISLTLIVLIYGKPQEENIVQKDKDKIEFRRKYYPTMIVSLVTLMLVIINLGVFGLTQLGLWKRQLEEAGALVTFTVNSVLDGEDLNPGDGICDAGDGSCTLRAVIQEANTHTDRVDVGFNIKDQVSEIADNSIDYSMLEESQAQRKTFYDEINGTYWALYRSEGGGLTYSYSKDGTNWAVAGTMSNIYSVDFSLYYKVVAGVPRLYVVTQCDNYDVCIYQVGVGNITLNWGNEQMVLDGSSSENFYSKPAISVSEDNYLFVASSYRQIISEELQLVVRKSSITVPVVDIDNLSWESPVILADVETTWLPTGDDIALVPQTGSNMVLVFGSSANTSSTSKYNGSEWVGITNYPVYFGSDPKISAIRDESGNTHLTYTKDDGKIYYKSLGFASLEWSDEQEVHNQTVTSQSLFYDFVNDKLTVFYNQGDKLYYKQASTPFGSGDWDVNGTFLDTGSVSISAGQSLQTGYPYILYIKPRMSLYRAMFAVIGSPEVKVIQPEQESLPMITKSGAEINLNASTQPGSNCSTSNLKVALNGSKLPLTGDGFSLNLNPDPDTVSSISGFYIGSFDDGSGVRIAGESSGYGINIKCNVIGLDQYNYTEPNQYGIKVDSNSSVLIGGDSVLERNVISGNLQDGVYLGSIDPESPHTIIIQNNLIGVTGDGESLKGNGRNGVFLDSGELNDTIILENNISGNDLNGIKLGEGNPESGVGASIYFNTITDNAQSGIEVLNITKTPVPTSTNTPVPTFTETPYPTEPTPTGAFIPTQPILTITPQPPTNTPVPTFTETPYPTEPTPTPTGFLTQIPFPTITPIINTPVGDIASVGDPPPPVQGLWSYRDTPGIGDPHIVSIHNNNITGNTVSGIRFKPGIGKAQVTGNILDNNSTGVWLEDGTLYTVSLSQNLVEPHPAIRLGSSRNLNDIEDSDEGPNGLQNYPVLTSGEVDSETRIYGSFNSEPGESYRIEVFGYTGGSLIEPITQSYIGFRDITTDNFGNYDFSLTPIVVAGLPGTGYDRVTTTASKCHESGCNDSRIETSELSDGVDIEILEQIPTPTLTLVPTLTHTPTPTLTVVPTLIHTSTPTNTIEPTPTGIQRPSDTPIPGVTETLVPILTNTPIPTLIDTLVPTATNTLVPIHTSIPTNTLPSSITPTLTPTNSSTIGFTDIPSTPPVTITPTRDVVILPTSRYTPPEESISNLPIVKSMAFSISNRMKEVKESSFIAENVVNTAMSIVEKTKPISDNLNYLLSLQFIGAQTATSGVSAINTIALVGSTLAVTFAQPKVLFYALAWFWRRKHVKPWGVVSDKVSSAPVAFARIALLQGGKTIDTQTTDLYGKYGFVADKGSYQLVISHSDYIDYSKEISIHYDGQILSTDFELSPRSIDDFASRVRWVYYQARKFIRKNMFILNTTLFSVGFVYTLFAVTNALTIFNYIILSLYLLQITLMILFYLTREKEWGEVLDISNGMPVAGAVVRLFDNERQLDVSITDKNGRYSFLLEPGTYYIRVTSPGYVFPTREAQNIITDKLGDKLIKFTLQDTQRLNMKLYVQGFSNVQAGINSQVILSPFS